MIMNDHEFSFSRYRNILIMINLSSITESTTQMGPTTSVADSNPNGIAKDIFQTNAGRLHQYDSNYLCAISEINIIATLCKINARIAGVVPTVYPAFLELRKCLGCGVGRILGDALGKGESSEFVNVMMNLDNN